MARNGALDHARLLAAFGIVFFHAGAPGAALGYGALPFFLMLVVILAAPAAEEAAFGRFAATRARRLLGPWLVWSAVYGALKLAELSMTGAPVGSEFAPWMVFTGPALHLWFLPFAFAASLAVHPVVRGAARLGDAGRANIVALLTLAALAALALRQGAALPTPLAQWAYAAPAVALGLLAVVCAPRGPGPAVAAGLVFFAIALAAGWSDGLAQLAVAGGALALCLALPRRATRLSQRAGAAALGVYLSHPLVLSVLERTTALREGSLAMAVTACIGALALTVLLARGASWMRAQPDLPERARPVVLTNTSS